MVVVEQGFQLSILGVPDLVPSVVIMTQPDSDLGQKGFLGALEKSRRTILHMHHPVDVKLGIVERTHRGVILIPPDISETLLPVSIKDVLTEMRQMGVETVGLLSQFGQTAETVDLCLSLRRSDGKPYYLKVDVSVGGFGRGDLHLCDPLVKRYTPTEAEERLVDFVHSFHDNCRARLGNGVNAAESNPVSQVFVQIAEFVRLHQQTKAIVPVCSP